MHVYRPPAVRRHDRARDLAAIHTLAAQLHMDTADKSPQSEYRTMLQHVGGATSASTMSDEGRRKVIAHLARLANPRGLGRGSLTPAQFIELLWQQLGDAGKLSDPGPGGLSKFIYSQTRVHLPSALDGRQAARIIEALKAWRSRGDAPHR